jgi:hypothetical protein
VRAFSSSLDDERPYLICSTGAVDAEASSSSGQQQCCCCRHYCFCHR